MGSILAPSPVITQKPDMTDAAHECLSAVPEFAAEVMLKQLRPTACNRVTEDGMWQQDVTSEKLAVREAADLMDVALNASTQRADNTSVDPQLHLLDFQLRHILKSSPSAARDEGSSAACDVPRAKTKNAVEVSPSRSYAAHSRSITSQPATTRDHSLPVLDYNCSRKPPHSGSVRCELAVSSGQNDDNEHYSGGAAIIEAARGRSSRSVERGRRPSYGRKDVNEDVNTPLVAEKGDMRKVSVDVAAAGGITFGGVEELSHCNVHVDDLPTTNIYLDDHATKAAPYTIASQFYSLGSEADDDDGSEGVPDKKMDDDGTCNVSPTCHSADKPRRPVTLVQQSVSVAEKVSEQRHDGEVWHRVSSSANHPQFSASTFVSQALSANGPLTPDVIPPPRFSVRSPSSPARLANDMIDSKPRQIIVEPADRQGIVSSVDNCVLATAPLAAQEVDGSDANSTSDVEALPSGKTPARKLATLNVQLEPRGEADGNSARIACEAVDCQRSEVSDRISSCSAELAGITTFCPPVHQMDLFTQPTADYPNIAKTSKVVPMAVAKKIADCLDVSLGSDKELKEIMGNGVPAMDRVDRGMSGATISRFAVVPKTVVEHSEFYSKVPNSVAGMLEPVNSGSVSVPSLPASVPANISAIRTQYSVAMQPCLSGVTHSRADDNSDTTSLFLLRTDSVSSPERLPRPPSGRVSKKAATANRARYVSLMERDCTAFSLIFNAHDLSYW